MRCPDGATLSMAEFRALQDVKTARVFIDKALGDWWGDSTFDNLHDAMELIKRAAWRISSYDDGSA